MEAPIVLLRTSPSSAAAQENAEDAGLAYDGYTSTDSMTYNRLHSTEWHIYQVKTRTFATNTEVRQYWNCVDRENPNLIQHQVLGSVSPVEWFVFKKPYNFHLKISDIRKVAFARDNTKIAVVHIGGRDGRDVNERGDVMAQFMRDRTKRRFLTFLKRNGVQVVEEKRSVIFIVSPIWRFTFLGHSWGTPADRAVSGWDDAATGSTASGT
jgi:hypothetical protein